MFTRCTTCGTGFRISADQLGAQHGQVRCGSCGEVFSALDSLIESGGTLAESIDVADAATREHRDDQTADLFHSPRQVAEVAQAIQPQTAPSLDTVDMVATPATVATVATIAAQASSISGAAPNNLVASAKPDSNVLMSESSLFLTPPRRRLPWLTLFGVLLGTAALAAQGAWFYRNELAVMIPATKPVLDEICIHAGCSLEPTLDAQAISIEASDLQADPGNRAILTLTAVIRNRAAFTQPLPHLEIALTDAQDTTLAKRVLKPGQYPASQSRLPTNGEAQVRLLIDAGQLKANGYRLYAFYP